MPFWDWAFPSIGVNVRGVGRAVVGGQCTSDRKPVSRKNCPNWIFPSQLWKVDCVGSIRLSVFIRAVPHAGSSVSGAGAKFEVRPQQPAEGDCKYRHDYWMAIRSSFDGLWNR